MMYTNKTILIVCEGGNTEPTYLNSIRDIVIDKIKLLPFEDKPNITIRISPVPKKEKEEVFSLRAGTKRRELKKLTDKEEELLKLYEVEEDYKAQPTRYVREAQIGLENGSFDEAWAVFDKDGHPNHKEAFEVAERIIKNKIVNIAFTSISFEHWVLLHFEQNNFAFNKSQCKEDSRIINCGTKSHLKDCNGSLCVCGYLFTKGWCKESLSSKEFLFEELPKHSIAIDNAIWLRSVSGISPIYEINPYTTIDRLVFRLINLPIDYIWFGNKNYCTKDTSFSISKTNNILSVKIKNLKSAQQVIQSGLFGLLNSDGEFYPFGEKKILGNEEEVIELDLVNIQNFKPAYLGMRETDKRYLFTDID